MDINISFQDFFKGIKDDFNNKINFYKSDWVDGWNLKVLAAIFFIFFTSIAPSITFAELIYSETLQIGIIEVLFSCSISGIIFSLFAGQPLVIVGVTGPVSILTISMYKICNLYNINFLKFYAWSQLWSSLMHMLLASFNVCKLIEYVTRFSCEVFGMLIALIYLYTGIYNSINYFHRTNFSDSLLQTLLTIGTFQIAHLLSNAKNWKILNEYYREIISDYGVTISVIFWTGISLIDKAYDSEIARLKVPNKFETIDSRNWLVDIFNFHCGLIFLAIVPGFIITVLFIFDHNVSSLMAQSEEMNLKKGSAYHLDFFVLGICIFVTGLLGIPPCNGLIPQAPLHVKALSVTSEISNNNVKSRKIDYVFEQRYSNLFQSLLILMMCFQPFLEIIGYIPKAILNGLFIFMGIASFEGNQFYERLILIITEEKLRISKNNFIKNLEFNVIKRFTLHQLIFCLIIFGITLTPISIAFPLFILMLIWYRLCVLPKYFNNFELNELDYYKNKLNEHEIIENNI